MIRSPEQVWVVPRAELFDGAAPHGCLPLEAGMLERIRRGGRFAERGRVEQDPALKQVIPYAVVVRGGELFTFRRKHRGGERRLFGLRSIGVGGHVNPVDREDVIRRALARELHEELDLAPGWRARWAGLVNDDTTPVGLVHLGVVAIVEPATDAVKVREADTMSGSFLSRADLLALHARERASFETWSALLLDRIDEVFAWARPHDCFSPTPSPTPTSTT